MNKQYVNIRSAKICDFILFYGAHYDLTYVYRPRRATLVIRQCLPFFSFSLSHKEAKHKEAKHKEAKHKEAKHKEDKHKEAKHKEAKHKEAKHKEDKHF